MTCTQPILWMFVQSRPLAYAHTLATLAFGEEEPLTVADTANKLLLSSSLQACVSVVAKLRNPRTYLKNCVTNCTRGRIDLTLHLHRPELQPLGEDALLQDQLERNRTHHKVTYLFSCTTKGRYEQLGPEADPEAQVHELKNKTPRREAAPVSSVWLSSLGRWDSRLSLPGMSKQN